MSPPQVPVPQQLHQFATILPPSPFCPRRRSLSHNSFTGSLPEVWGSEENSLAALYLLDLGHNRLSGSLPKGWGTKRYALSSLASIVIAGEWVLC